MDLLIRQFKTGDQKFDLKGLGNSKYLHGTQGEPHSLSSGSVPGSERVDKNCKTSKKFKPVNFKRLSKKLVYSIIGVTKPLQN